MNRTLAILTGFGLLLMAALAGFSYGYVFAQIYIPDNPTLTQNNLTERSDLYQWMVVGFIGIALLDTWISWAIYRLFKQDNQLLAMATLVLRVLYTLIFFRAIVCLILNNGLASPAAVTTNFEGYLNTWTFGLVFFGIHLIVLAFLMKLHVPMPKVIWSLTLIGGVCYVLINALKVIFLNNMAMLNDIENILAPLMALGELGLAFWLIARGGKKALEPKNNNFAPNLH